MASLIDDADDWVIVGTTHAPDHPAETQVMHVVEITIKYMFGVWLWITALVTLAGLVVGAATSSWGRRWTWVGVFAVACLITILSVAHRVGAVIYDQDLIAAVSTWTVWFLIAICVGIPIGVHLREQSYREANLIPDATLLETIEHLSSLPVFASMPWFARRWADMSRDSKLAWIRANQADIRRFVGVHGGLESTPAADLVVELQRIDRHAQVSAGSQGSVGEARMVPTNPALKKRTDPRWLAVYEELKAKRMASGEYSAATLGYPLVIDTDKAFRERYGEDPASE